MPFTSARVIPRYAPNPPPPRVAVEGLAGSGAEAAVGGGNDACVTGDVVAQPATREGEMPGDRSCSLWRARSARLCNVPSRLQLAGFQVSVTGRSWVFTGGMA